MNGVWYANPCWHLAYVLHLLRKDIFIGWKSVERRKILLTSVIIHPLTALGRFNLPMGILKSGDLISSALHCQSCQVQRARRKERLLSRPSGGEDRREWREQEEGWSEAEWKSDILYRKVIWRQRASIFEVVTSYLATKTQNTTGGYPSVSPLVTEGLFEGEEEFNDNFWSDHTKE